MSTAPTSRSSAGGGWIVHRYPARRDTPIDVAFSKRSVGGIMPVGAMLIAPGVWSMRQVRSQPPYATTDITAVLESVIDPLRRLDDAEGGSTAAVGFVQDHIVTVETYLGRGESIDSDVRRRLLRVSAQLYQLAGWMAYDAERHTTAQRYFAAGLRTAREIDDTDMAAYILACTACHLAYRGRPAQAVEVAEAAVIKSRDSHPAVRSVTASRLGYCQAAAGDISGFRAAADEARRIWADQPNWDGKPDFLYWYSEDYIDIQRSESLQLLAATVQHGVNPIIREADVLLDQRIQPNTHIMPRDAALHTAGLARVHVKHGDLNRAVSLANTALDRLGTVRSPRVLKALQALAADLGRCAPALITPGVERLHDRLLKCCDPT
ncbi:MAG TPA: hypothetical protein VHU91_06635 [Mycobacteriales bacterium]|nr:hypothetical protein [Mycobacteriales bacterium]